MKTLRWVGRVITAFVLGLIGKWLYANFDFLPIYYFAYPTGILLGILAVILLILGFCFLEILFDRRIKLKEAFEVFKPVEKLTPEDFHITSYNEFYIERESDKQIEELLRRRDYVFITGIPMLGKTRMAYKAVKKLKGFYLLKPKYERIDVQKLKLPLFKKKIVLFFDDLDKYLGKFNLDWLIARLKKKSKDFVVIATCRSGQEFDEVFAQKDMEDLLTRCAPDEVKPRRLIRAEEEKLAAGLRRNIEEIESDGTPGSIVVDLRYMKQRYRQLGEERNVLKCLKLLREGYIFLWSEGLIREVAKRIFGLEREVTGWRKHIASLEKNGFLRKLDHSVLITHDVYLDDKFLDDYFVEEHDLILLKEIFLESKDAEDLYYLGSAFLFRNREDQALDCYRKCIELNPDFLLAHYDLATVLKDLRQYDQSETEYRRVLRIVPSFVHARNNLAVVLVKLRRYDEAEQELRKTLDIDPSFVKARNNLGFLLARLKRYEPAEKEYRGAIRMNPNYVKARYNLVSLLLELGRDQEAKEEFAHILRITPERDQAHVNLGNRLAQLGRYKKAEEEYLEALRINPAHCHARNNLANALVKLNRREEAEREYREVIRTNPRYVNAHHNLGSLLFEAGKYEEAQRKYRDALLLEPHNAEYRCKLGIAYMASRRDEEAEEEFRIALRIDPNLGEAHVQLGLLLMVLDRKNEAKRELGTARDLFRKQGRGQEARKMEELLGQL